MVCTAIPGRVSTFSNSDEIVNRNDLEKITRCNKQLFLPIYLIIIKLTNAVNILIDNTESCFSHKGRIRCENAEEHASGEDRDILLGSIHQNLILIFYFQIDSFPCYSRYVCISSLLEYIQRFIADSSY